MTEIKEGQSSNKISEMIKEITEGTKSALDKLKQSTLMESIKNWFNKLLGKEKEEIINNANSGTSSITDTTPQTETISETTQKKDKKETQGSSIESKEGTIVCEGMPYISQNDPRRAKKPYPYRRGGSNTIANSACGVTSFNMVLNYLTGKNYTPDQLLMNGQYHSQGTEAKYFQAAATKRGVGKVERGKKDRNDIKTALKNKQPIVSCQNGKGPFTKGGHYIVLRGIDKDGNVLVHDPNGNHKKFSNRTFTKDQIMKGMNFYCKFESKESLKKQGLVA